jgi:hypothetical protein
LVISTSHIERAVKKVKKRQNKKDVSSDGGSNHWETKPFKPSGLNPVENRENAYFLKELFTGKTPGKYRKHGRLFHARPHVRNKNFVNKILLSRFQKNLFLIGLIAEHWLKTCLRGILNAMLDRI